MSRRRKHRLWTADEKRSICQQACAPGVSIAQVAKRYSLNSNLIHKWLKDPRFAPTEIVDDAPVFLPVDVKSSGGHEVSALPISLSATTIQTRIEIMLTSGHRLSIEGQFDGGAVAEVVKALTER
jgi:transposase